MAAPLGFIDTAGSIFKDALSPFVLCSFVPLPVLNCPFAAGAVNMKHNAPSTVVDSRRAVNLLARGWHAANNSKYWHCQKKTRTMFFSIADIYGDLVGKKREIISALLLLIRPTALLLIALPACRIAVDSWFETHTFGKCLCDLDRWWNLELSKIQFIYFPSFFAPFCSPRCLSKQVALNTFCASVSFSVLCRACCCFHFHLSHNVVHLKNGM